MKATDNEQAGETNAPSHTAFVLTSESGLSVVDWRRDSITLRPLAFPFPARMRIDSAGPGSGASAGRKFLARS